MGLVTENHPADFAQQTLELLEQTSRREELGKKARVAAETAFSWEKMTRDLETFYSKVLEKAGPN